MTFTLLSGYLFGSLLLTLLLSVCLFFYIKYELSELEMLALARNIELKTSIKEQIKGGIDFHNRKLNSAQASKSLPRKSSNENKA